MPDACFVYCYYLVPAVPPAFPKPSLAFSSKRVGPDFPCKAYYLHVGDCWVHVEKYSSTMELFRDVPLIKPVPNGDSRICSEKAGAAFPHKTLPRATSLASGTRWPLVSVGSFWCAVFVIWESGSKPIVRMDYTTHKNGDLGGWWLDLPH